MKEKPAPIIECKMSLRLKDRIAVDPHFIDKKCPQKRIKGIPLKWIFGHF